MNEGVKTYLPYKEIPTKLCRYSTIMEGKPEFPFLKYILCIVTFFQRKFQRVKYRNNSKLEKPNKLYFSQVVKVNINSQKLCW